MKEKSFDCVQMKHEIQQRILKEFAGLTPEQQRQKTQDIIQSDPALARFWKSAAGSAPSEPARGA